MAVRNKSASAVQITAEQIIREANEGSNRASATKSVRRIADAAELADVQQRKRREFEGLVTSARSKTSIFLRYAKWEEKEQLDVPRSRAIYERALEDNYRLAHVWLQYAEMEIRNEYANHARNILDRAVTLLPKEDALWLKYVFVQEVLGDIEGTRAVFERWLQWQPDDRAWSMAVKFEKRHRSWDRVRELYQRWIDRFPKIEVWIKFAKFEEKVHAIERAREIYETALKYFGDQFSTQELYIAFAEFEVREEEMERARAIFRYGIDHLSRSQCEELYRLWTQFEKSFGDREGLDSVIFEKKRFEYETQVAEHPHDVEAWLNYVRLAESLARDLDLARSVFRRATSFIPESKEKQDWRRYIFLWIRWAVFEELIAQDLEATRHVYRLCLDCIPHKRFTFAKIWIFAAQFELRQMNLGDARKLLGAAIGKCPKQKLFEFYISLERNLGEYDRCRILFGKHIQHDPTSADVWIRFAGFESDLEEVERARSIFRLGCSQGSVIERDKIFRAFIEFEMGQNDVDRVRELYELFIENFKGMDVWLSFAVFEAESGNVEEGRAVLQRAQEYFKEFSDLVEERVSVFSHWLDFEHEYGSEETVAAMEARLPRQEESQETVVDDDGNAVGVRDVVRWIFPDDQKPVGPLKILEMAQRWKQMQMQGQSTSS
eukprot:ANDGO_05342.mRNA.1 Pre-mRNA-splicing factor clf1